ncbi:uncharacterized protein TNCV_4544411 [Trichonephila clavipes]|nr:uncharacterized protein TNCV_4544411 [Trichonephila clavipes]
MLKRKCLSTKANNIVIHEVDKGVKNMDIALKFGITPKSLSTNIKNREKLQNYDSSNSCSKHLRTCVEEDVDEVSTGVTIPKHPSDIFLHPSGLLSLVNTGFPNPEYPNDPYLEGPSLSAFIFPFLLFISRQQNFTSRPQTNIMRWT